MIENVSCSGENVDHDPHRLLEIAFVVDRRDALDPAFVDQRADPLHHPVACLLEGNPGDDDPRGASRAFFDSGGRLQYDRAAAGMVSAADAGPSADHAAGREVGTGADFHQLIDRNVRLFDHLHQRPAYLADVVRRNRGRHTDRNSIGPVDQQVGELRRQHGRLGAAAVIRGNVVDRVLLQIVEQRGGNARQAGLGVPHGRRRQARDRTEVSLLVDQHRPHVPLLGHPHERRVDHGLAVRMVITAGVTRNLGTLHAARSRPEVQVVHGDQNPPLRRLQPVAHIGQRPADNHAHGVCQVGLFQFVFDRLVDIISAASSAGTAIAGTATAAAGGLVGGVAAGRILGVVRVA